MFDPAILSAQESFTLNIYWNQFVSRNLLFVLETLVHEKSHDNIQFLDFKNSVNTI